MCTGDFCIKITIFHYVGWFCSLTLFNSLYNMFCLLQIPFSLTLRVWDLYLLEGERVMIAMAYNILRMHRRYLSKLQMDEIIEHLQVIIMMFHFAPF